MNAGPERGRDAGHVSDQVSGEPVRGRLGAARAWPALGGLGIVIGALIVAAVVAWPYLSPSGPEASPTSGAASPVSSADGGPTPSAPRPETTPGPTVIVEQTIVDRPGVPPALYDKYWVAVGQVGQVGTTARMVMPSNEGVLGADAGRVASIPFDSNFEPIVGPNGVTITVRDLRSGATLRTFDTEVLVLEGLMTGSLLFWTGRAIPLEGPDLIDGGIWVIDLADPASEPRAIIPPADLTGTFGPHASRGLLRLTDRGRALITLVQSDTTRATDVIDVASLTVRQTLEGVFAVEVLGGLAVVSPIHGDGADPEHPNRLRLIDIATGIEIGSGVRTDQVKATSLGEGEVFAQYGRDNTDSIIIAMDLETGEIREIRVQLGGSETLDLSHVLSAPSELVLLSVDGPELDSNGRVQLSMTLLDPVTGALQPDAFTVGSP